MFFKIEIRFEDLWFGCPRRSHKASGRVPLPSSLHSTARLTGISKVLWLQHRGESDNRHNDFDGGCLSAQRSRLSRASLCPVANVQTSHDRGLAQLQEAPATCLTAAFKRFHTLIRAIETIRAASAFSS